MNVVISHESKCVQSFLQIRYLCELIKWCDGYPTDVLDILGQEDVELEYMDEFIPDKSLKYLAGRCIGKYVPTDEDQVLITSFFMERDGQILVENSHSRKYYAATKYSDQFKRKIEYRCEEGETKRNYTSRSSVVCMDLDSEILVGRIQYFNHIHDTEMALVKWYGEIQKDSNTRLWKCLCEEPFKSCVNIESLSRPLVHAWEGQVLWLLNYHDPLLI